MRSSLPVCLLALFVAGILNAGEYRNELKSPDKALVLKLDRESWQALTAACATPAFYNASASVPLIFDDGTEKREVVIPHESAAVKDFGKDAQAATAAIAMKYWKKTECVFVVSDYEQALWVVPSAAVASAPILVNPSNETLAALGVKKAVVVGDTKPTVAEVVTLADKQAVWKFHVVLLAEQNKKCDYVVITNPHDTDEKLNPNVQWPYLSLAAAPLAAFRQAIVQTGDFTSDRAALHALGVSLGDAGDKAKYDAVKPCFLKVKGDCSAAAKFLSDNGCTPKFLGMVGGSVELPYYVIDLHAKFTYWNLAIDYVPADTPYATLRDDTDFARFVKPDLAVGRIMADSIQDATLLLARTFFRKEYLPGGKYAALAPEGWEKKSVVYDGHRLNQPDEGGPDATPNEPFHPAAEVEEMFKKSGLKADYVFPRDETKKDTTRPKAPDLFTATSAYGYVQHVAHGDPPYLRIEAGKTGKDMKNYLATGPEFRKRLNFQAPTAVYVIGCNVGTANAPFKSNDEFIPTSAIHAGAVAYMAPNKCQAICFWRFAPKGPGASQCIYFWENALVKKLPVGEALIEAKWRGYNDWKDKQSAAERKGDSDNCIEIDAPSMVLFGDPALRLAE
jgi:hypothetical protein